MLAAMMWRNVAIVCFAVMTGMAQARAAGIGAPQQDAPFTAATVREFLALCGHDMSQCDYTVRSALLDKLNGKDATSVCLKGAHYQEPVIAWLQAHPQTAAMATEDGIYAAFKSLYPCP